MISCLASDGMIGSSDRPAGRPHDLATNRLSHTSARKPSERDREESFFMAGTVGRRVTAADITAAAGVARATVGFVLNNTPGQIISEGTRQRVLAEAARLGYRPHRAAHPDR